MDVGVPIVIGILLALHWVGQDDKYVFGHDIASLLFLSINTARAHYGAGCRTQLQPSRSDASHEIGVITPPAVPSRLHPVPAHAGAARCCRRSSGGHSLAAGSEALIHSFGDEPPSGRRER